MMEIKRGLFTLCFVALASIAVLGDVRADIAVIVNKANPVEDIDEIDLKRYFLKEKRKWPGGGAVVPVIRQPGSVEAALFNRSVLKKDARAISQHWQLQKQTIGMAPPQIRKTDTMVYMFVALKRGAVGYVSTEYMEMMKLRSRVKVVKVIKHASVAD